MGRKTDYDQAYCHKAFELCQAGATDFELAETFDCHVATLYRWKAAHPEFAQAMKLGKDLPDDRAEATLYHRGIGYTYHAIKIVVVDGAPCSVPYIEHVPPDTGALMQWLANRRAQQWRNRQTTQLVGDGDGPVQVRHTVADDLSDDQLAVIASGGSPAPPQSEKKSD